MRRLLQIALAGWVALSMSMAQAFAFPGEGGYTPVSSSAPDISGYTKDDSQSDALTAYLKGRRLPLVGAQVLHDPSSGQQVIVLYGFVATAFGKSDATTKARAFLKDPSAKVENRVKIDPEIASLPKSSRHNYAADGSSAAANPDASSAAPTANGQADADANAMPGVQGYLDQQNQQAQIQQYQNQQNPLAGGAGGMTGGMVPLVALLGLLSAANGGSSFSFGSSGPFGRSSPYQANPYGGSPYGSPYESPYGSPHGAPPGAFPSSPYGSPYSPPPGSFSPYP